MTTIALAALLLGLVSNLGIILVVVAFAVYAQLLSADRAYCNGFIPNELFPTDIRASAVGVIMSLSRIGTVCSTGHYRFFCIICSINNVMLIGVDFVSRKQRIGGICPETRGLTLTQTGNMTLRGTPSDNPR